jgi:hypothetical protein
LFDPQDAVGASGTSVDVGDGVGQKEATDLAVVGLSELDVVIGRAIEADDLTGPTLGVTQVVQSSDNLELPFGSVAPSSKRALAALTILSSASSSLTRRRAARSGSCGCRKCHPARSSHKQYSWMKPTVSFRRSCQGRGQGHPTSGGPHFSGGSNGPRQPQLF